MSRTLLAAIYYFAIVFAVGFVLGPPRVLWLQPFLGDTLSVLCEAPLLIGAMSLGARWSVRWAAAPRQISSMALVGVVALTFQQIADLAVGFGLRGMTLAQQIDYFATPPGMIYAFCLVVFALMPALVNLWNTKAEVASPAE